MESIDNEPVFQVNTNTFMHEPYQVVIGVKKKSKQEEYYDPLSLLRENTVMKSMK